MKQALPTFKLAFTDAVHYVLALSFVSRRHPQQFDFDSSTLTLMFFSDDNREEMKRHYDILGWKSEIV